MTTANITLKVPFNEKDQAKALGARWNAESKHWYVPQGVDAAPFEKWITNSSSQAPSLNTVKPAIQSASTDMQDKDIDAINARLRDAFELREIDEL